MDHKTKSRTIQGIPKFKARPRPGVILEIIIRLEVAGVAGDWVSVEEILEWLQLRFPARDVAEMEVTVRAQLSRLPRERGIPIQKRRDGRNMLYSSAG